MNVYFTVDTESSIGAAWRSPDQHPLGSSRRVFCRIGDEEFGIPRLTRIMGKFGFRGTFFVETLATRCLGEADMRPIFEFLLREEQDVQLHIHPIFRFYSDWRKAKLEGVPYKVPNPGDLIGSFSEQVQLDLLGEAIGYFERFAGYRPTAFRAGNFAGSRSMMKCLHHFDICVDSSFNPCFHPEVSFPGESFEPNLVQKLEGVWEVPVTVARTRLWEGHGGFKFADCTSLSFPELRTMLDAAAMSGQRHFVLVCHSFSTVKSKDETYAEMRPNRIVIRRLEKMFQYLADNGQKFRVETMGNAATNVNALEVDELAPVVTDLPLLRSVVRKTVQLINNAYWC